MTGHEPRNEHRDDRSALYSEIDAYENVGALLVANPDSLFVSGWDTSHPFVDEFLGELGESPLESIGDFRSYSHLSYDKDLAASITRLHHVRYAETAVRAAQCIPSGGAGALLSSLLHFQKSRGFSEVCYIPPMYYNASWWVRRLGLQVWRAAVDIDFADASDLALPNRRTMLWISDPLWFAGVNLRDETMKTVANWQQRTGSTVIVDGTFQYMHWSGPGSELSSSLDPDLTFRMVCPTKALALHGFRFAYAIVPEQQAAEFGEFHLRMHGTSGLVDSRFAYRAIEVLTSPTGASPLMQLASRRYRSLADSGRIVDSVVPQAGYFAFAKLAPEPGPIVGMGGDCFGTAQYREFVRINLLSDPVAAGLGFDAD